jgi:1-acyl-sn-glycerol-3-phosphate acyltransferase
MRIMVEGTEPQPPFFVVSNHLSYLDVVTLASQLDCRRLAGVGSTLPEHGDDICGP